MFGVGGVTGDTYGQGEGIGGGFQGKGKKVKEVGGGWEFVALTAGGGTLMEGMGGGELSKQKMSVEKVWMKPVRKSQKKGGSRPVTPTKNRKRRGLPGSPESIAGNELRGLLSPIAPSKHVHSAMAEDFGKSVTSNVQTAALLQSSSNGMESIGDSFGLTEDDLFSPQCGISSVLEELSRETYTIHQGEQFSAETNEPISLFH